MSPTLISKKRKIDRCISNNNPARKKSKKLMINAGAYYIPKDNNPARPRGDDAHFFNGLAQVIGVADGVGGWAKRGVDPGEYARQLMANAAEVVEKCRRPAEVNPMRVLAEAYLNTYAEGASTACIISVAGGRIRAANLGDSGFLVVRSGRTVYKSEPQQHRFNCPYQMGSWMDTPEDAAEVVVVLEKGDVIVAGTDGLFDNLFDEDIEAVVRGCLKEEEAPEVAAWRVAKAAREQSREKEMVSPFEVAAYEAGKVHFGGKRDDITVVIAYVEEASSAAAHN